MGDETVTVVPTSLKLAARELAGRAAALGGLPLVSESGGERSGVVAAAFCRTLDLYCREFAQTLSDVSVALMRAADAYALMENGNAGALDRVVSARCG